MEQYHNPVLLHASVDGLNINPSGIYVDVTFGGGGHSREILSKLGPEGKLVGFDQDPDAEKNKPSDERLLFIRQNFRFMKNFLKLHKMMPVDGILADLGVSSHQFDVADRGFSTRFEGPLDMRMNQSVGKSAADVLNEYKEEELRSIFANYGEMDRPGAIAKAIVAARAEQPLKTSEDLKKAVIRQVDKRKENQFYAKLYQALRIEVNQELDVLKEFLKQSEEILKPGGRLVVISYHSLEDRLVKNFMRSGKFEGDAEKDFYGNPLVPFKLITRKPIVPEDKEIEENNRARSARLRIAERL
jgi:16S rRNA (cytosine1402-N4)-methyltransferase